MRRIYLAGYCFVYILLGVNAILQPSFYHLATFALYACQALLALAMHWRAE